MLATFVVAVAVPFDVGIVFVFKLVQLVLPLPFVNFMIPRPLVPFVKVPMDFVLIVVVVIGLPLAFMDILFCVSSLLIPVFGLVAFFDNLTCCSCSRFFGETNLKSVNPETNSKILFSSSPVSS